MPPEEKNIQPLDPEHLEGAVLNNRYRICSRIGRGGTAVVYLAWDLSLEKEWAVKILRTDCGPQEAAMFRKEAGRLKQLGHPFLPRIVEIIPLGNSEALVMDFLQGRTLEEIRIREGAQDEKTVRKWALWILDVLMYLHEETPEIIFRDLKPANVILREEGGIWLVDFGIASERPDRPAEMKQGIPAGSGMAGREKQANISADCDGNRREERTDISADCDGNRREKQADIPTGCTGTGWTDIPAGTPGYAPPEQMAEGVCDAACDRYALGMLMYAMLSGQEPDEKTRPGPELSGGRFHISVGMIRTIETCIRKDPVLRFENDEELKRALLNAGALPEQRRRQKNHQKAALLCSVLLSAVCLAAGIFFHALSAFTTEQLYEKKLSLVSEQAEENSGAFRAGRKTCLEAIALMPGRPEGYERFLDICTASGFFTEEDADELNRVLDESGRELNRMDTRVQKFYLRAAVAYFCLSQPDESGTEAEKTPRSAGKTKLSFRKGILYAEKYFTELSEDENTGDSVREEAGYFATVCGFFRGYQIRMDPTEDAGQEEYEALLKSVRKCILYLAKNKNMKSYAVLSAAGEMAGLLNSQREWMKNLGIPAKDIQKTLETIEDNVNDVMPGNQRTKEKKERVLAECGRCRAALEEEG